MLKYKLKTALPQDERHLSDRFSGSLLLVGLQGYECNEATVRLSTVDLLDDSWLGGHQLHLPVWRRSCPPFLLGVDLEENRDARNGRHGEHAKRA